MDSTIECAKLSLSVSPAIIFNLGLRLRRRYTTSWRTRIWSVMIKPFRLGNTLRSNSRLMPSSVREPELRSWPLTSSSSSSVHLVMTSVTALSVTLVTDSKRSLRRLGQLLAIWWTAISDTHTPAPVLEDPSSSTTKLSLQKSTALTMSSSCTEKSDPKITLRKGVRLTRWSKSVLELRRKKQSGLVDVTRICLQLKFIFNLLVNLQRNPLDFQNLSSRISAQGMTITCRALSMVDFTGHSASQSAWLWYVVMINQSQLFWFRFAIGRT